MPIDLGDNMPRMAILSQLRLIDSKRLYQKIGTMIDSDYRELLERIICLCKNEAYGDPKMSEATP